MRSSKFAGLAAVLAAAALSALPSLPADAAERAVRVVCDDNYPPYSFRSPDGAVQGIIPDHWREWSRATGRQVEFRGLPWKECQEAMASGEADVIDSMFRTPERELAYDFLEPYAMLKVPVFFHESISGISQPEDLRGFRVAVKAGDACIPVLEGHGIVDMEEYPDYESIVRAAASGEIKVFCVDEPPALYYLYKLGADRSFRSALNLYTGKFHRAALKSRPPLEDGADLLAVVGDGFDSIPPETYRSIERRWFGVSLERRIDPAAAASIAGAVLLVLALLGSFALALKAQVARKTKELSEQAAALAASERKNRAFIQALPDLFIVFDAACRYRECKAADPALLVRPEPELIGRTPEEVGLPSELSRVLAAAVGRALAGGSLEICEYELEVIAGRRWFEARVARMEEDRALVIVRDITDRTLAERKNAAALKEKEVLLKEVYHRVKNNMQVVSGLLHLQAETMRDERDKEMLAEMQRRIKSMALIHERLYRSEDLHSIDGADYIESVVEDLKIAYLEYSGSVRVELDLDPCPLSMDTAVALGLVVNETVSNSYKYAFKPRGQGVLRVALKTGREGRLSLSIEDDGPGISPDWREKAELSLGLTLVDLLADQLQAELSVDGTRGTRISMSFSAKPLD